MAKDINNAVQDNTTAADTAAADPCAESNKRGRKKQIDEKQSIELNDMEEIPVISLIPHVSYLDKNTQDMYEWETANHTEYMTVGTLKEMWKNNKGYFRNLWLKPLDERILIKFGLVKVYEDYEFLMKESSYTKENFSDISTAIGKIPDGMKFAVVSKIKQLVSDGSIRDISIIKMLGKKLDTDFLVFA